MVKARDAFLSKFLAKFFASFLAGSITVASASEKSTTSVTEDGRIAEKIGLRLNTGDLPGDSLSWGAEREQGWKRYQAAARVFPKLKPGVIESYLVQLSKAFQSSLPSYPKPRFQFYVTDTLNASIWPAGGGFFIIHGGVLRLIEDEKQFALLLALEMAHDALGHVRSNIVKWGPRDFQAWPVEFWSALAGRDPIESGDLSYSLPQENEALSFVFSFFQANAWPYEETLSKLIETLKGLRGIPHASSLPGLHRNLAAAEKNPLLQPEGISIQAVDHLVDGPTYQLARSELGSSRLQRHRWMLELAPYSELLMDLKKRSFDSYKSDLKKLEEIRSKRKPEKGNQDARLAFAYATGLIQAKYGLWKEAFANADRHFASATKAEPLLWQRMLALQQLGQFNRCGGQEEPWPLFDHRRELLIVQCAFLDGHYTTALNLADKYRKRYPFDVDGAFWQALANIRMRRDVRSGIEEIENFWGDRPMVRALKIFHFGYLGKHAEAREAMSFQSELAYSAQEWGMLAFAQSWYRRTFFERPDEARAAELTRQAEADWPLAKFLKYNLPRDPVQNR